MKQVTHTDQQKIKRPTYQSKSRLDCSNGPTQRSNRCMSQHNKCKCCARDGVSHFTSSTLSKLPHFISSFFCRPCNRTFINDEALQQHLSHSSEHVYCTKCRRDFVSSEARESHFANSERHNVCPNTICQAQYENGADFDHSDLLLRHYEKEPRHHFRCHHCKMILALIYDSTNITPKLMLCATIVPYVARTTHLGPSYSTITQQAHVTISVLNATNISGLKRVS